MSKKIPFFDYPQAYLSDRDDVLKIIDSVSSKGSFILQSELEIFEKSLAEFSNSAFALGVGNATDGLELAWMSVNLQEGDEVIISSHTMLATASAIKLSGGTPVPVDIGDDGLIDVNSIESAITSKTKGISPTHLNGRTCDMDSITRIAEKYDLVIIEDAAQALGSTFKGKQAGTFGYASAISFYPAKVLGCLGDGGAILTNSQSTYSKLKMMRDHGRNENGEVEMWGRNSRLDNIQAAILDFRLASYQEVIKRRREIASIYHDELQNVNELYLPPPPSGGNNFDIFQNYEIQAELRDKLKLHLANDGIGTLIQWGGKAVHHMSNLGFDQNLLKTDLFFQRCIMLPMNMFISNDDVQYICKSIKKFYSIENG